MERAEKIIVVDDENSIRMLLEDALAGEGFEVSLAKDGQAAHFFEKFLFFPWLRVIATC